MSVQAFATGKSILGGTFVITVSPPPEPKTPAMADAVAFSVIVGEWIGTEADNAVNVVDYLHERDGGDIDGERMG